jgi:ABC-type multidrug transport system fused ATPase/permease subunit
MQRIPNALAAFDLKVVSTYRKSKFRVRDQTRFVLIGRDFMVRGHGERCRAAELLFLWRRPEPILSAEPEMRAGKSSPGSLEGAISISHVTFRYQNSGRLTLDDVTVEAKPGEFVAIVGPSRSKKSTLLRLVLGFETPASGTRSIRRPGL